MLMEGVVLLLAVLVAAAVVVVLRKRNKDKKEEAKATAAPAEHVDAGVPANEAKAVPVSPSSSSVEIYYNPDCPQAEANVDALLKKYPGAKLIPCSNPNDPAARASACKI